MTAPGAAAARPAPGGSRAASALVGVLVLFAIVHLYRKARGVTFYYDEWDFVLDRRPWNVASLLEPHNEHLSLVPVLVYKVIMSTLGIADHDPYLVVLLLLHGLCGLLMYLIVRRRLGDWLGVCAAALVLFLGTGWMDVIWAFQIGFLGSIAAGLGAVLALGRRSRRGDLAAGVLLAVAVASSSLGLPILGGAIVYLVLSPDRRARLWVWAVPLALYAVWYLVYGKSAVKRENLTDAPAYAVEMMSAGMAGLVNQAHELGRILFGIGAYILITRLVRAARVPPALIGLLAAGLAFWGLTALARAHIGEATASRYVYPSAVVILLIGAEAARGLRVTRGGLAVAAVVTGAAALSGLGRFHDGSVDLRGRASAVRVSLAAVELAGPAMPPEFVPEPNHAPQVAVGPYLEAIRDLRESPALPRDQLPTAPPNDRLTIDNVLIGGLGARPLGEPGPPAGVAPALTAPPDAPVRTRGACATFTPSTPRTQVTFPLPEAGVRITPQGTLNAQVTLRRFADTGTEIGEAAGGRARLLRVRPDEAPEPWVAAVVADEPVEICGQ